MKTAISIPDETFEAAERRAQQMGVSRSEFFTTAARRYLEALDAESLTERMNEALGAVGEDESSVTAQVLGRQLFDSTDDW